MRLFILWITAFVALHCFVEAQIASNLFFENVAVLPFQGTPAYAPMSGSLAYFYGGGYTKTAFIADLATGTVYNAADGLYMLEGACAAISPGNDTFVMGGDMLQDGSGSATFQYLASGFNQFATAAGMYQTRQYHRCIYAPVNDRLYTLGGYLTSPNYILLFTMESWAPIGGWVLAGNPLPNPVSGFAYVIDNNQTLLVLGGTNESNVPVDYVQLFNFDTNTWTRPDYSLAIPQSNMGYTYVPGLNMVILCGGDEAKCQYFQPGTTPKTGVITTNLQPSNFSFAQVSGPNLYVVQKTGQILVAKCALDICPYGCVGGICADAPTPVAAAPFSGCSQCSGDTAVCIAERGVCVGTRVVPILQCIDTLDNGKKRGHFSYNNLLTSSVNITSNTATNYILPSGTPISSFTPGRSFYYPLDAFTVDSTPSTMVEWFIDGYSLSYNTSDTTFECPTNVSFGLAVSPVPSDTQTFIDRLTSALATVMGVTATRIQAEFVNQKRQSNLEAEIEVTVSKGEDSTEPSPAEVVSNFVANQTAVQRVQEQVPEVQKLVPPKPLPNEARGQNVVPATPTTAAPVAPKVPIVASSSVNITERIFLPMNVLWICLLSVVYVWIQFG